MISVLLCALNTGNITRPRSENQGLKPHTKVSVLHYLSKTIPLILDIGSNCILHTSHAHIHLVGSYAGLFTSESVASKENSHAAYGSHDVSKCTNSPNFEIQTCNRGQSTALPGLSRERLIRLKEGQMKAQDDHHVNFYMASFPNHYSIRGPIQDACTTFGVSRERW